MISAYAGGSSGRTRRDHLAGLLPAFTLYALLRESRAGAATYGGARRWVRRQEEIARALASGGLTPLAWCLEVERLAKDVEVAELARLVDASRTSAAPPGSDNDPAKRYVTFLDEEGRPQRLAYGVALFDFRPQNVITPHGHRNMVSAHLVLRGQLRIRNFDRVGDEPGLMIVRPTRDILAATGHISTMCAERDNVHWFTPHGGPATSFDVIISGLDARQPDHDIQAIDPLAARPRADGTLAAPLIGFEAAAAKYTARV